MDLAPAGDLDVHGWAWARSALRADECAELAGHAASCGTGRSGGTRRLLALDWCQALARRLRQRVPALAGSSQVAVQCTYFEKSTAQNWLVPLHQDLAIPVRAQVPAPGFSAWSRKEGDVFVQPPAAVLQQLTAVRVHLDACSEEDGPLQVVPGSHRLGILDAQAAAVAGSAGDPVACIAGVGDALVMRPLLLHASSKATGTGMRRVLHFVFGPPALPHGVAWRHAV